MKDLFDCPEKQPQEVKDILQTYECEDLDYSTCENMLADIENVGYTFEYDLEGQPFNLKKLKSCK